MIKRTLLLLTILGIIALFSLGWFIDIEWNKLLRNGEDVAGKTPQETVICGAYAAPSIVMGSPATFQVTLAGIALIGFPDRYILTSGNAPSLFLNRKAVFYLEGNKVVNYALVNKEGYHPCPE